MKLYRLEVGVLIDESNEDYIWYNTVYDHKHGYYDEDSYFSFHAEELKEVAKKYVKNGVDNTYGVITEFDFELADLGNDVEYAYSIMKEVIETWYIEDWVGLLQCLDDKDMYDIERVVYSLCKRDETIIENFVK